ncbi:MAG: hypothetical protein E7339_07485 [Clostridiales bacterium]|nr:hypothetical protein [Clostridiales bacterium]
MSKTKFKIALSTLIFTLICSVCLSVLSAHTVRGEDALWTGTNITATADGFQFASWDNNGGANSATYSGKLGDNDTVTFQYMPSYTGNGCNGDTTNLTLGISDGTRSTAVQLLNYWNAVRLYIDGIEKTVQNYEPDTTDGWSESDQWFKVTYTFLKDSVTLEIDYLADGQNATTITVAEGVELAQSATIQFTSWGANAAVKDFALSNSKAPSWSGSNLNRTEGGFQFTSWDNNGGANSAVYSEALGENNTVSFQYMPSCTGNGCNGDTTNLTLGISDGTRSTAVQLLNYWNAVRLYIDGIEKTVQNYEPDTTDGWSESDQWFKVTYTFLKDSVTLEIDYLADGKNATTIIVEEGLELAKTATIQFTSWGANAAVKDFALSKTALKEPSWSGSNLNRTEGGFQFTSWNNNGDVNSAVYSEALGENNTVSFQYMPSYTGNGCNGDTTNLTLGISDGTRSTAVQLLNYWNAVRLYIDGIEKTVQNYEPDTTDGWSESDQWFKVTYTFLKDSVTLEIDYLADGKNATTIIVEEGLELAKTATIQFTSWGANAAIKDFALSYVEPPKAPGWYSDYYDESEENGEKVLTANTFEQNGGGIYLPYSEPVVGYNTVTFKYRPNSAFNGYDTANIALHVDDVNGSRITFEFLNYWNCYRIILNGATKVESNYPPNTTDGWSETDVWFEFKCVFAKNNLQIYVDGTLMKSLFYTDNFDFENQLSVSISAWGSKHSVKGIEFSNVQISEEEWGGSGYEKSDENGEVVYNATESEIAGGALTFHYLEKVSNVNTFTFKYRANEYHNGDDTANVCFNLKDSKGNRLAFQLLNYWNCYRIILNNTTKVEGNYPPNLADAWTETDVWFEVKCVFAKNYARIYIDGELMGTLVNTEWFNFDGDVNAYISSWGHKPTVKDMQFTTEELEQLPVWYGSSFTQAEENGEVIYTANHIDGAVAILNYAGVTGDNNSITFDLKPGTVGSHNERNAGFIVLDRNNSGTYLFFEIMPERREARVRIVVANTAVLSVKNTIINFNANQWSTVQCIFEDNRFAMYINGKLTLSAFDLEGYTFSDTFCYMNAWDTAASYKNISFEKVEKSNSELGYGDFDFLDERGVESVMCENANFSYNKANNSIEFEITDSNPVINLDVNQLPGAKYSAYLPVRNTILVRMANATSAEQLILSIKSDGYSDRWHTKTFDIDENSGYTTYYFNLSDLNLVGYLTDVKLEFVGADSGSISIDAISFEREDGIYDYAATEYSMTATQETVTYSGKVQQKYAGKTITLYSTSVVNIYETVAHIDNKVIAKGTVNEDGSFEITFPFKQKNSEMNHLSTIFIAAVDGVKLSKTFQIENYRDFIINPYAFKLPEFEVKVTDAAFGAVGDGFTNDNEAIQKAIDYVHAQGGGKVIVPGDLTNAFGRRYIATNLELKSNVELCIEEGAVIWQSPRVSDYNYDLVIGHDYESEVMWPHACNKNQPLILVRDVQNVRITGGGTIRMADWGGEDVSAWEIIDPNHGAGCTHTIHIAPIFCNSVTNIEITDIKILRTNNWNLSNTFVKNAFYANIHFGEPNCKNGDGIGMTNCENMLIVRNRMFSSDDAFTINAIPNDPRKFAEWAYPTVEVEHYATRNVELAYNNMRGGLGIVFIGWGSNMKDFSKVEIQNIVAYNNVFAGFGQDIGSWPDNPFYGWSSDRNYNLGNGEKDDYSPLKDVYMFNNEYTNGIAMLGWQGCEAIIDASNFITDANLITNIQFNNASFERNLRYDNEVDWISGLSYWSKILGEGASVGIEARGEKQAVAVYTQNQFTVTDYAGYVEGSGKLYQGIYLEKGAHKFTVTLKSTGGNTSLFFANSVMKQHVSDLNAVSIISSEVVDLTAEYAEYTFIFRVEKEGVYAIGVCHEGEGRVYLDDASVERDLAMDEIFVARDELSYQVEGAQKFTSSDEYTQESIDKLLKAIEDAQVILANKNATIVEITGAETAIRLAIEDLEVKPEPDPEPDPNPYDSSSSVDNSTDSSSEGSSSSVIVHEKINCNASLDVGSIATFIASLLSIAFIVRVKRK